MSAKKLLVVAVFAALLAVAGATTVSAQDSMNDSNDTMEEDGTMNDSNDTMEGDETMDGDSMDGEDSMEDEDGMEDDGSMEGEEVDEEGSGVPTGAVVGGLAALLVVVGAVAWRGRE